MKRTRILVIAHSAHARDSVLWRHALEHDERFDLVVPLQESCEETLWAEPWIASGRVIPLQEFRLMSGSQTRLLYRGLSPLASSGNYAFAHISTEPWSLLAQTVRRHLPIAIQGAETVILNAPMASRVRRLGGRKILRTAVGVSSWGSESLDEFIRCGVPDSTPTAVIPMGIPDPEVFTRIALPIEKGIIRLLFVGRLVPEKGVDDLLNAILGNLDIAAEVRIAGSGPEDILAIRAMEQDSRIKYLGPLDASSVHDQLAWAAACVIPSRRTRSWTEQWGRIAVEAMLTGRPIITSDSGELRRLNPNPALIFPASDVQALGDVIRKFSASSSQELDQLADAAHRRALHFIPEEVFGRLQTFWNQIIDG